MVGSPTRTTIERIAGERRAISAAAAAASTSVGTARQASPFGPLPCSPMSGTHRLRRVVVATASLLVLAAVAVGCGGSGSSSLGKTVPTTTVPGATVSTAPPAWQSVVAQANVPTLQVYDAPNDTKSTSQLPNPWVVDPDYPDQTVKQVFLVKEQRADGWIKVLLPVRPNGSTGWVRASDVLLSANPFHIKVELGAHRITVTKEDSVIYQGAAAVGASATPTPTGEYYLRVLIKAIDPNTVYGPYAYGLSSHSDVLETFAGGDAEIGIHGNNDASVLGQNVTHGCVRIDNAAITSLAKQLPLGTPVDVVA
jgi:lipoprotein-anchoring transpeptidase ErfK/SrfK